MKLFVLLGLVFCVFAETPQEIEEKKEEIQVPTYTPTTTPTACENGVVNVAGECKQYSQLCGTYPGSGADGNKCNYHHIGTDTNEGKCEKKIGIVLSDGSTPIPDFSNQEHKDNSCMVCAKYTTDGKCAICATGYLLNKGNCTALSINPFGDPTTGTEDENKERKATNENCFVGEYQENQNTIKPMCVQCSGDYYVDDGKCILAETKPGNHEIHEGCLETVVDTSANALSCQKCREGYTLAEFEYTDQKYKIGYCVKSIQTTDKCAVPDAEGKCTRCIPGYYTTADKRQCSKCSNYIDQKAFNDHLFTDDECKLIDKNKCGECNPNCESDETTQLCKSKHCDLFDSSNVCIRCEQGYQLTTENKCEKCQNECFTSADKTTCIDGYYLAKDKDNNNVCRKCEGMCKKCVSKDTCIDVIIDGFSLNSLPCFDPNCKVCSASDQHICLECNDKSALKSGRCYPISDYITLSVGEGMNDVCRYYKQPDFITNKNADVNYDQYSRVTEMAYAKDVNENGERYLCEYHDNLPHYYRYYEGQLSCAGANRDPNNDCECKVGYYSESIYKYSDCKEFTKFKFCEKPITDEICGKCQDGLVLKQITANGKTTISCGCPDSHQRPNHNGVCVDCPTECESCQTVYDGDKISTKCDLCLGKIQKDDNIKDMLDNNYYRDNGNLCQCKKGYESAEPRETQVFSCYPIPTGCNGESDNKKHYTTTETGVSCKTCDEKGFSVDSSCFRCESGYYQKTNTEADNGNFECALCPKIDDNADSETYCTSCEGEPLTCTSCIDENLDPSKNCKECRSGYSLKFKKDSNEKVIPYCVECPLYCGNVNECFLANEAEVATDNNKFDDFKQNSGTKTKPYTEEQIQSWKKYCNACHSDNESPQNHCECANSHYSVNGECRSCKDVFGKEKISINDEEKKIEDFCAFDGDGTCKYDTNGKYLRCTKCLEKYSKRTPESNCTRCPNLNQFVTEGDGGCGTCKDICNTCTNGDSCTSCKDKTKVGDQCDQCSNGHYKDSSNNCLECHPSCTNCTVKATNCHHCKYEHRIPNGEDGACNACEPGYYFDPTDDTAEADRCKPSNKNYGFLESKLKCYKDEEKTQPIDCDIKNKDEIKVFDEIATKCDVTLGVGIQAEPVDGKCVCAPGYVDERTSAEIAASPFPQCTDIRIALDDDFCKYGEKASDYDTSKKIECKMCNADYLEIKNGECVCKNTHYTTSWGMCVPCGRHNKGCKTCTEKYKCSECESGYTKKEENGKVVCVGK